MLHAVIMAGGTGTRFWPASRSARPKQLLDLTPGGSMIRQTLDRLAGLIPKERCLVVTSDGLLKAVRDELPDLPEARIVGEPCKRDTAPCIGLAALLITRHFGDPDAAMAVMPADHVIAPTAAFQNAIRQAEQLVTGGAAQIVTFGIKPTYAAESFGYIQRDAPMALSTDETLSPTYHVAKFREKPTAEVAAEYVQSGEYYWNSGIFVWRASTILAALQERQPQMVEHLEAIVESWGSERQGEVLAEHFAAITPISVDHAVMEQATNVAVIEAPFDWDDLGSWQSLARRLEGDAQGNTVVGKHFGIGTHNSIVRTSPDHLVVTLGLQDTIVVHTPDATLVANKHDEEAIRQVVQQLEKLGWTEYL